MGLRSRGPLLHHGGRVGFIGSCVDVTDRVEAQEALRKAREGELDQLRGIRPICACCKAIRDGQVYWQRVEAYIAGRSPAQFTHGLCPACLERHFPE